MNMKNREKITMILNEWDPIELFPFAPQDEYEKEVNTVVSSIEKLQNIKIESLSNIIFSTYFNSFGDEFDKSNKECEEIATKIIDVLS